MNILSVREGAQLLGISPQAVYRLIDRGTLASITIGANRFLRRESVEALLRDDGYRSRRRAQGSSGTELDLGLGGR
jgi:excisionase family DNA binding protein